MNYSDSYDISILQALGARAGARILEYGANWGYSTFQFERAGFDAEAYDISRARAEFGKKLGISVLTDGRHISGDFDIVYSCHVLEHVPNPTKILEEQIGYLRRGDCLLRTRRMEAARFGMHIHAARTFTRLEHFGLLLRARSLQTISRTSSNDQPTQ